MKIREYSTRGFICVVFLTGSDQVIGNTQCVNKSTNDCLIYILSVVYLPDVIELLISVIL